MDEAGVRTLLERLAADDPLSRVDIGAARARGRRWRRRRWITLTAAPLAAVAAAAALTLTGALPFGAGAHTAGQLEPAQSGGKVTAVSRFSVLTPYASFGWLPPGFSASAGAAMGNGPYSTSTMLVLGAGSPSTDHELILEVYPAGVCSFRSDMSASEVPIPALPPEFYIKRYHRRLAGACDGLPLATTAPAVGGDRAFWTPGGGLVWEYAPGSWAHLQPREGTVGAKGFGSHFMRFHYRHAIGWRDGITLPGQPTTTQSAATRADLLKVAAGMRYDETAPLLFGFQLSGLSGGWQPQSIQYTASGGRLLGTSINLAAAGTKYQLVISVSPVTAGPSSCSYQPSPATAVRSQARITLGGTQWVLGSNRVNEAQGLCTADDHGLQVRMSFYGLFRPRAGVNAPRPPVTLLNVYRHLRLLGPDPAKWTSSPLG